MSIAPDSLGDFLNGPVDNFLAAPQGGGVLSLLFDPQLRALTLEFVKERVLPYMLGVGIIIVGIVFILSGTKLGEATGVATAAVVTKGKSLL